MSPIIRFNVGGKHYDVSRLLLEKYPNTVLATAASEIGDDDNIDHQEPIFIERNGERFQYVLDYMRDGNVSLPYTISRMAFIRDLDYLGFHNLPLGSIPNYSMNPLIPDDLKYESGVQFHQIIWDATRSTQHVRFDNNNCLVRNHYNAEPAIVFGRTGFSSGVHFWNVKILQGPCIVGVETDNVTAARSLCPITEPTTWSRMATAKTDDIIGILLNYKKMYCKEYRNGQRIQTLALGPGILYPYVQFQGYQEIISCEVPSEKNIFHFPREEIRDNTMSVPKELRCIIDVESHQITWNPLNVSPGLMLANNRHVVKRTAAASWEWHSIKGSRGFSDGAHYWSFRIKTASVTANIMIGICSNLDTTRSYYAGIENNGGSYCGTNGNYYYYDQHHIPFETGPRSMGYGPTFTNGDIIGTLLDMTHKTLSFYKNGIRCGCATRVRIVNNGALPVNPLLSDDIYYPCVAFGTNGDEVLSCEVSHI